MAHIPTEDDERLKKEILEFVTKHGPVSPTSMLKVFCVKIGEDKWGFDKLTNSRTDVRRNMRVLIDRGIVHLDREFHLIKGSREL